MKLAHAFADVLAPVGFRAVGVRGVVGRVGAARNDADVTKHPVESFPNGCGSWSCTASVERRDALVPARRDGFPAVTISHLVDGDVEDTPLVFLESKPYDLRRQRDWMEFVDAADTAGGVSSGSSAYDVLRCDLVCNSLEEVALRAEDAPRWKVWGEEFHLNRLRSSYRALARQQQTSVDRDEAVAAADEEEALRESAAVIRTLLFEAHKSKLLESIRKDASVLEHAGEDDVFAQLVRVSIMWTPTRILKTDTKAGNKGDLAESARHRIVVRGHASSTGSVFPPHRRPIPIEASLAVKGDDAIPCEDDGDPLQKLDGGEALPNRQGSPQLKISSWSRLRRPLETKRFKPPGVSEVLMVRRVQGETEMEILEGLTSNFFAIYRDGTIRTAQEGILHGYARHLVLECARRCGLSIDTSPVLMRDAVEGRWAEAFITSSSRLIFPIERIIAPEYSLCNVDDYRGGKQGDFAPHRGDDAAESENAHFEEFWSVPGIDESMPWKTPRWEALYDEMLKEGGYG